MPTGVNIHPRGTPIPERIADRVLIDGKGCWVWTGRLQPNGYAMMAVGRKQKYVHRLSYEAHVGPIPDGLDIDHLCRNRACCNPSHLEPVTRSENNKRGLIGEIVGRRNRTKTHCINGHPFNEENTYWRPTGGRACRACAAPENPTRFKDRCPSGHLFTLENTGHTRLGHRYCRECNRLRARAHFQRKKQMSNFIVRAAD